MFSNQLKEIKGRLEKEVEANPQLGKFPEINKLKRILSVVVNYTDKIEVKNKFISNLKIDSEIINHVIMDVCAGDLDKMEKMEFYVKFLARKTYSCINVEKLSKGDFIALREYVKANAGIEKETPEEVEARKKNQALRNS